MKVLPPLDRWLATFKPHVRGEAPSVSKMPLFCVASWGVYRVAKGDLPKIASAIEKLHQLHDSGHA